MHAVLSVNSLSHVRLFATPWPGAHQAPLSMGILQARILKWAAMPSSKGIFLTQGLNPGLPHCRQILYQLSYQRSPYSSYIWQRKIATGWTFMKIFGALLLRSWFLCGFVFHIRAALVFLSSNLCLLNWRNYCTLVGLPLPTLLSRNYVQEECRGNHRDNLFPFF